MSEHIEAQQAAAERLGALGLNATLMVHFPSKIKAPEGIPLTTYDQLHSQIAKQETTAYAFPSFGAAQSAMRTLATMQQTVIFIYECHANTGPVEIAAKVFDTCHRHVAAIREIKQLTGALRYQKYPTVLYLVKMDSLSSSPAVIEWQISDTITDELIMPARIAFENFVGKELRQGNIQESVRPVHHQMAAIILTSQKEACRLLSNMKRTRAYKEPKSVKQLNHSRKKSTQHKIPSFRSKKALTGLVYINYGRLLPSQLCPLGI